MALKCNEADNTEVEIHRLFKLVAKKSLTGFMC